jgi:hypothetical protein
LGAAAAAYSTYAAVTWYRYGRPSAPRREEHDALLDRFMPVYDVVERHHTRIVAPAALTLTVARNLRLFQMPLVRAIVRTRELVFGASADTTTRPEGLLAQALSLGWVVLAEVPEREIVVGAVTRPWEANVIFRPIPAERFEAFDEPEYVKIVWTLRADPIDPHRSIFRTETRAVATDRSARSRFRTYWSFLSPGIFLIRWMSLGPLRTEAKWRARIRAQRTPEFSPPTAEFSAHDT